jgi:hypothetical protein
MRQINLPRPERPDQKVPERKRPFGLMNVLEDRRKSRLKRQLSDVQDGIHALGKKRVLILQQKEWAKSRADSFDLTQPPPLAGLGRETFFSVLKVFPSVATMCSVLFGSVCSALSKQAGAASRAEMFTGFLEAVSFCSLVITCLVVKSRVDEFLGDVESQITERLSSLYGKKLTIERKLGFVKETQEKT